VPASKKEERSMMNFQEMKLDEAIKILKYSGLNVSEERGF